MRRRKKKHWYTLYFITTRTLQFMMAIMLTIAGLVWFTDFNNRLMIKKIDEEFETKTKKEIQQAVANYRLTPTTAPDTSAIDLRRKSYDPAKMLYSQAEIGESFYTINTEQLAALIHKTFPAAGFTLAADKFALIDRDWFWHCFNDHLQEKIHNQFVWTPKFDCNNFAGYAKLQIDYIHNQSLGCNITKVAFGEFLYEEKPGVGHAINILITVEKGTYGYELYEPQSGKQRNLTPEEEKKVFHVKF